MESSNDQTIKSIAACNDNLTAFLDYQAELLQIWRHKIADKVSEAIMA
jgi:hypothetical protein